MGMGEWIMVNEDGGRDIGYWILDIRYSIFDIRYSIFDIRYSIFDIRYSRMKVAEAAGFLTTKAQGVLSTKHTNGTMERSAAILS
jgi:hypothetical protein